MQKIKRLINKKYFPTSLPVTSKVISFTIAIVITFIVFTVPAYAANDCGGGKDNPTVHTSIDLGCKGKGNPILDLTFAIIRFLTVGVGLITVGSLIVAGIQYTASSGDPQATAKALKRIANTVGALILFIFIFAILNWVIPAGLLK